MRFWAAAVLLMLSGPAFAQDRPAAEKTTEKRKEEKQICRQVDVTGSYLGSKRECHTKAEWERRAEQAREAFRRRLTNKTHPLD
jgi:hypothetical protein